MNALKHMSMFIFIVGHVAGVVLAKDFPLAGGDLANDSHWGGSKPSTSEVAGIIHSGSYVVGDSVEFLAVSNAAEETVFTMAEGRTLTLNCDGKTDDPSNAMNGRYGLCVPGADRTMVISGGVWNFTNGGWLTAAKGVNSSNVAKRHKLVIKDGAKINGPRIVVAWRGEDVTMTVTNATIETTGVLKTGYAGCKNVLFEVLAGGKVRVGDVSTQHAGSSGDKHTIYVGGRGAELIGNGGFTIGQLVMNESATVEKGGSVSVAGDISIGPTKCDPTFIEAPEHLLHGTKLVVRENGSVATQKSVLLGGDSYGNLLLVDDGTLEANVLKVGVKGPDNIAAFTNAALTATSIVIGEEATSTGNSLILGPGSTMSAGSLPAFGADSDGNVFSANTDLGTYDTWPACSRGVRNIYQLGPDAKVKFTAQPTYVDGGSWNFSGNGEKGGTVTCAVKHGVGSGCHDFTLRINDGVRYECVGQSFYFSIKDLSGKGYDNTIYIGTNAVMRLTRLRMGNYGNVVEIDNGRLELVTDDLFFGYVDKFESAMPTNKVVFRGSRPMLKSESDLYPKNGTGSGTFNGVPHFEFNIPAEGYAEAPLQAKQTLVIEDAVAFCFKVDFEAIAQAHDGNPVMIPILSGATLNMSDRKVAELTAQVAPKGRFVKSDNTLYLRSRSTRGMILTVR